MDREFWNREHSSANLEWLGCSPPTMLCDLHHVTALVCQPGYHVIDLGVGTGAMSAHLKSLGARVTSVDISDVALGKSVADHQLLVEDLRYADPADLMLCHLVFQHCEDEQVEQIIHDTPLLPAGFMSVQYATLSYLPDAEMQKHIDARRMVYRTEEEYSAIFKKAGRSEITEPRKAGEYGPISWRIVRLK